MNTSVSPSRTYIVMCNKPNFDGYYFRRFTLPALWGPLGVPDRPTENSSVFASWYFLHCLNFEACIDGCFAAEDLGPAAELVERETTQEEKWAKIHAEMDKTP